MLYYTMYGSRLERSVLENAVNEIFKTVCRVADNKRMLLNDFWATVRRCGQAGGGGRPLLYRTDRQTQRRQRHLRR